MQAKWAWSVAGSCLARSPSEPAGRDLLLEVARRALMMATWPLTDCSDVLQMFSVSSSCDISQRRRHCSASQYILLIRWHFSTSSTCWIDIKIRLSDDRHASILCTMSLCCWMDHDCEVAYRQRRWIRGLNQRRLNPINLANGPWWPGDTGSVAG